MHAFIELSHRHEKYIPSVYNEIFLMLKLFKCCNLEALHFEFKYSDLGGKNIFFYLKTVLYWFQLTFHREVKIKC